MLSDMVAAVFVYRRLVRQTRRVLGFPCPFVPNERDTGTTKQRGSYKNFSRVVYQDLIKILRGGHAHLYLLIRAYRGVSQQIIGRTSQDKTFTSCLNSFRKRETVDDGRSDHNQCACVSGGVFPDYVAFDL